MPEHRDRRHDPSKNLVGFFVGDVHYAVPIALVREVSNPLSIVELPHAPHAIRGVSDYRGEIVPVIDLRARFGLAQLEESRRTKWIVVRVAERHAALVVDAVTEPFGTGGAELLPPPVLGGGEGRRGILGVTSHEGRLTFVLETERFQDLTEPLARAGLLSPSGRPQEGGVS